MVPKNCRDQTPCLAWLTFRLEVVTFIHYFASLNSPQEEEAVDEMKGVSVSACHPHRHNQQPLD